MILLNFSHSLTGEHLEQIELLAQQPVERVLKVNSHIDPDQSLIPQVVAMVDGIGLSAREWETLPLVVNPPSLNFLAVTLLAELQGRCGHLPACLRMRPIPDLVATRYEVAEVLNLQSLREAARGRRNDTSGG